jgi:hypothetical protein
VTFEARVDALVAKKFTERQARFLVTVMLHSGVCMIRQYCAFAGMVYGQTARDFFARLTSREIATAFDCAHKRARIYHIHHRALYEAIGEPHTRFRKPTTLARAVERLMLLDAVLANPEITWLATEQDKVAHFAMLVAKVLRRDEFPHLVFGDGVATTVRYFPDKLPIGVTADGREHIFLYLITRIAPVDFRPFLLRHANLLRALPRWTTRLLVPPHLVKASEAHVAAARQELASPLRPAVVDDLRWFFEERRRIGAADGEASSRDPARFLRVSRMFTAPRYRVLYRSWIHVGDAALDALASPVLAQALSRESGRIECQVLPRPYLHLSPLAGTA